MAPCVYKWPGAAYPSRKQKKAQEACRVYCTLSGAIPLEIDLFAELHGALLCMTTRWNTRGYPQRAIPFAPAEYT